MQRRSALQRQLQRRQHGSVRLRRHQEQRSSTATSSSKMSSPGDTDRLNMLIIWMEFTGSIKNGRGRTNER